MLARLLLVGWLLLIALLPQVAPFDPMTTDAAAVLQGPGRAHLLGTDQLGRDVLSRLLVGGRRTLMIAGSATGLAVAGGLVLGIAAAATRRWSGALIGILIDALLALPALLIALVGLTLVGTGGPQIALVTGLALIAQYARVSRAAMLAARSAGHIMAAESLGATRWWVLSRHVIPAALPVLLSYGGVIFSYSLLNSAALSFLGLGGALGQPDWGAMLFDGRQVLRVAPWVSIAPGLALSVTVLLVNGAVTTRSPSS